VLTDDQKEKTAFHEAGHAVVGLALPKCDPVYKATIIPRGGALGMVVSLPEIDRLNWHRSECEQKLAMTMAGKAAEILKYGEDNISNGPAGDIQQASGLARAMVMRWGMSDKVGNVDYEQAHEGYMGNAAGGFSISAHTKELIEEEVRRLIDEAYQNAKSILEERREEWQRLAEGLLEYETLTGDQIRRVMAGDLPESDDDEGSAPVTEKPSVIAVPKTKSKSSPGDGGDGGLEPEPST
ncbi:MAG: ATP-dependent zinc metalloprotease FtsH, partial [Roseovarius sp.]